MESQTKSLNPQEKEMQRVQNLTQHLQASTNKPNTTPKQQYRYSVNGNGLLTKEQQDFYEENGFLVIKKCFSEQKVDQFRKRFKELCENPSERPPSMIVMRDVALAKKGNSENSENVVTKVQEFHEDEILMSYCRDPQVLKYTEAFIGPRIVACHTMLINKPTDPGQGTSRHPLHQDLLYFPFRPIDKIVAAWTAMERVTRENGCLIAVPGSHKTELLEHGYPDWEGGVNKAYVGIMGVTPEVKYVHLTMEKGDTVFFHPLLWHGSGRNLTPNFRKAICCHFASGDCNFINVKGTIQEDLETEITEMMEKYLKKRGADVDPDFLKQVKMSDVWAMKSRVVQGDQMILDVPEEEEERDVVHE